jgi:hypothetical protein
MKRVTHLRFLALTGAALLCAGGFTPARAQADPDDTKRGVARISVIDGDVSVRRGDSGDWVAGVINAPLLTDDRIATGPNSRAEVQLDAANTLRMGGNAEVRMAQLEYGRYQMEVAHGIVTYRVLRQSDADVEVDTPNISVRPSRQGTYRISVGDSGDSEVTARAGDVEVFSPTGSQWVRAGQTMVARGTASNPEFQIVAAIPRDEWDRWNETRDRIALESASYRYVPQGVYGAEDLDRYGSWRNDPEYGNCWQPTVAVGWSPYSSGRWVWEDWYGWTWVSYDPWGWAPYHYGRWFYRDRWLWYPGTLGVRHYWSPALVGFIGWGGGGVGFGMGNIGWVPLAPYETFHPWWGRNYYGRGGYNNRSFNITNVNITNVYRNSHVNNGIIGMRGSDFQGGRFNDVRRYSGNQIREASVVRGAMPIGPNSANLRYSDRQVRNVPQTSPNTRFFARQQPNPAPRISFAQQQRAFEQGGSGGPVRGNSGGREQQQQGLRQTGGAQPQTAAGGGWRRFGETGGAPGARDNGQRGSQGGNGQGMRQPQAAPAGNAPAASGSRGGWQRFGTPANGAGSQAAPRQERQTAAPQENRGAAPRQDRPAAQPQENRGGWQRFGAPAGGGQAAPRSQDRPAAQPQDNRGSGWNRFGSPAASPRTEARQPQQQQQQQYRSSPAPSYSAPRSSAPPSYSAPRSYGGGGGSFNAPRQSGGGGGSYSAPRQSGGGGGSYSAPRQSGGGGGGSFSAPRSSGGGGSSAPRSSGGGGGGGGNRGGGGGGGNRRGR